MHDDGSQVEQYGPPCELGGGFNHSPKHYFKGKHDINNLMEKMSLGSSNQHQNGFISIMGSMNSPKKTLRVPSIQYTMTIHIQIFDLKYQKRYRYQPFQDHEKVYETNPQVTTEQIDDTLYPQINNDIEYGLFEKPYRQLLS